MARSKPTLALAAAAAAAIGLAALAADAALVWFVLPRAGIEGLALAHAGVQADQARTNLISDITNLVDVVRRGW